MFRRSVAVTVTPVARPNGYNLGIQRRHLGLLLEHAPTRNLDGRGGPRLNNVSYTMMRQERTNTIVGYANLRRQLDARFVRSFTKVDVNLGVKFDDLRIHRDARYTRHNADHRQRRRAYDP